MSNYRHILIMGFAGLLMLGCKPKSTTSAEEAYASPAPEFCADSAMAYAQRQCEFGPRTMNSAAHDSCGAWIAEKFRQMGAEVSLQATTPKLYDGTSVRSTNITAVMGADKESRIIIGAHWDARPWADNDMDEKNWHTPIDAANDGASGVAVMLELARQIQQKAPSIGVEFVCFDAEDSGTPKWADDGQDHEQTWCLGSQDWAAAELRQSRNHIVRFALVLDMVGGQSTVFQKEGFSLRYAPQVVDKVWAAAHRIGQGDYFQYEEGGYITDDHLQVNRAGIPCIDIIGSDKENGGFCRTWHTIDDNIQHLDKNLLKAVGQTLLEVIYTEE